MGCTAVGAASLVKSEVENRQLLQAKLKKIDVRGGRVHVRAVGTSCWWNDGCNQ